METARDRGMTMRKRRGSREGRVSQNEMKERRGRREGRVIQDSRKKSKVVEAEETGKEESVNFEDILLVIRPSESTCFCHHFLPLFLSVYLDLSLYVYLTTPNLFCSHLILPTTHCISCSVHSLVNFTLTSIQYHLIF